MVYDRDEFEDGSEALLADLFTDRLPESVAFAEALAAHRRRLDDTTGAEDSPRGRNVLVFHGMGGIGKSELSRRLEKWVAGKLPHEVGWGPAPETRVDATVRIDLHGTQGHIDGAERLAEMREQLSSLRPRWPLFDVAFAAYWASTHPSKPLPVVGSDKETSFVAPTLDTLRDLTEDILPDAFESPSTFAGLGARVLKRLVEGIAERITRRLAIAPPPGYDGLFLRCTSEPTADDPKPELLGRLAELLTWELNHWAGPIPMVVVFLDTFERLDLDERREGEKLLNLIAYLMPNVLFVVTGRNRLTWWELNGSALPRRGHNVWPLLAHGATEEPHQHALEYLSDHDRRVLLGRIRDQLGLPMSDLVFEAIADQSGGLPEYIRLAKEAALTCAANHVEITAEAVTGSLEELVARILEDVPTEGEQAAIRAAALFPRCSPEIVAATAGVSDGVARRALSRPLFEVVDTARGIVTMHDRVRAAIRDSPLSAHGGWSGADWRAAGSRALVHLRDARVRAVAHYSTAVDAGDAPAAVDAATEILRLTGLAVTVVCAVDADIAPAESAAYTDWLTEAIVKGPSFVGLRPYVPAVSRTDRGRDILDFLEAKTPGPLDERTAILRRLLDGSPTLSWIAGRHLAYALDNSSRWDEAIGVFDELLALRPGDAFVTYQRALRLYSSGRFRQARDAAPSLSEVRSDGLLARVRYAHGEPGAWGDWTRHRVESKRREGIIKDALEVEGLAIRVNAIIHGRVPGLDAGSLRTRAESIGHETATRDAIVADALIEARLDEADLRWLTAIDRARNEGDIGFREATARAVIAVVEGNEDALALLQSEVLKREASRGAAWIPFDFLLEAKGLALPDPPGTEWIDDRAIVAQRWATIWSDWQERVVHPV